MLKVLFIYACLMFQWAQSFEVNVEATIPEDVLDFDYSYDQEYLTVLTKRGLNIYQAQNLRDVQGIIANGD